MPEIRYRVKIAAPPAGVSGRPATLPLVLGFLRAVPPESAKGLLFFENCRTFGEWLKNERQIQ
jgi:hypothetical protein